MIVQMYVSLYMTYSCVGLCLLELHLFWDKEDSQNIYYCYNIT